MISIHLHQKAFVIVLRATGEMAQGDVIEIQLQRGQKAKKTQVRVLNAISFDREQLLTSQFLQMQLLLYHGQSPNEVLGLYESGHTFWLIYVIETIEIGD